MSNVERYIKKMTTTVSPTMELKEWSKQGPSNARRNKQLQSGSSKNIEVYRGKCIQCLKCRVQCKIFINPEKSALGMYENGKHDHDDERIYHKNKGLTFSAKKLMASTSLTSGQLTMLLQNAGLTKATDLQQVKKEEAIVKGSKLVVLVL